MNEEQASHAKVALEIARTPWRRILVELRTDRGILLGTDVYAEMNGIERTNALSKIENAIFNAQQMIEKHEEKYRQVINKLPFWKRKGWRLNDRPTE